MATSTNTSKIPPLLQPYLLPLEASLILLTSVLGASTNWLLLRFLHQTLLGVKDKDKDKDKDNDKGIVEREGETKKVVLLSFLRDWTFWRDGGRRLGLDLDKLSSSKRVVFIDGLSGLFLPGQVQEGKKGERVLRSCDFREVERALLRTIGEMRGAHEDGKVVMVIDGLDFLLASTDADPVGLSQFILSLREQTHALILTLSSDLPLVSNVNTPLETNHASFLLSQAHEADLMIGLRLLDSGVARDVSGVLRVTGAGDDVEEKELLYFVGGDGGVRVFERGN